MFFKTSLTLHHTYGVPYLPGSALKGLAAHYAMKLTGWEKGSKAYNVVFGDPNNAGYITFFDALPIDYSLHRDAVTVHHPDYYQSPNIKAPTDWDSPKPIPFISVRGHFLIALGTQKGMEDWLEATQKLLIYALEQEGIGAKTTRGYRRLEPDPAELAAQRRLLGQQKAEEEAKRKQEELGKLPQIMQEMIIDGYSDNSDHFMKELTTKWLPKLKDSDERVEIAQYLKEWYQTHKKGEWEKPTGKNLAKVSAIKSVLGET